MNKRDALIFLGTGAGEAIPAFYCRCSYCDYARTYGGKDVRSRSSFRIDGKHQIDYSPDIFHQMVTLGLDMHAIEHLLITHTHTDHFAVAEFIVREYAAPVPDRPLHIYVNRLAMAWADRLLDICLVGDETPDNIVAIKQRLRFVPLDYERECRVGDLTVVPLRGTHTGYAPGEDAMNFLIGLPDGRTMYYAVDTGYFKEETFTYLQGRHLDMLVMECTFGDREDRPLYADGHLDIVNFNLVLERLLQSGTVSGKTRVFATHINHKHHSPHDRLQDKFARSAPIPVTVAYDGLQL